MRYVTLCALLCLCAAPAVRAQTTDAQMMAPIDTFLAAFNKGDVAGAAAAHASEADLVIIDEVPPFIWRGAQAVQTWAADLEKDSTKNRITEPSVSLGAPTRIESDGSSAYVIVPSVYTFKQKGTRCARPRR
jgi:hypothetical protein